MTGIAEVVTTALLLIPVAERSADDAINRREGARGRYQIRECYVRDANRILGKRVYEPRDAHNPVLAKRISSVVLGHYAAKYQKEHGHAPAVDTLLRWHNGGPTGDRKQTTDRYVRRARGDWGNTKGNAGRTKATPRVPTWRPRASKFIGRSSQQRKGNRI